MRGAYVPAPQLKGCEVSREQRAKDLAFLGIKTAHSRLIAAPRYTFVALNFLKAALLP